MATIITSECVNCPHGTMDNSNKAKVTIHYDYKDKDYYYGQCVPCDYSGHKKKKE